MKQIKCLYCEVALEEGQEVVQFLGEFYCTKACLLDDAFHNTDYIVLKGKGIANEPRNETRIKA